MKKKNKVIRKVIFVICACILGSISFFTGAHRLKAYKPDQNIYFREYVHYAYEKNDTIIHKCDSVTGDIMEIARINGYFEACVVNKEETHITGIYESTLYGRDYQIYQLDLASGNYERMDVTDRINELIMENTWKDFLLYDDGNKIFISYSDEEGGVYWLFYDLVSGDYKRMEAVKEESIQYVLIYNNILWYRAVNEKSVITLYQYDLESRTKTEVKDDVTFMTVEPDAGLVAYINPIALKADKIYLYDINTNEESVIVHDLESDYHFLCFSDMGENEGNLQLYYEDNGERDTNFMIYDLKTGERYCIYKKRQPIAIFIVLDYIPYSMMR